MQYSANLATRTSPNGEGMRDDTTEDLIYHLNRLPQELYDTIYEDVFSAEPGDRIINEDYTFPAQLSVSRATRKQFALSYYQESSAFIAQPPGPDHFIDLTAQCLAWAEDVEHVKEDGGSGMMILVLWSLQTWRSRGKIARVMGAIVDSMLRTRGAKMVSVSAVTIMDNAFVSISSE